MSVLSAYRKLIKNKEIKYSQHQAGIIRTLQKFDNDIGFFSRYKGVYLYGEVGRGKSFIMDLYFNHSKIRKKQRVHYHEFIQTIHKQLNSLKNKKDPILLIGKLLAKKVKLLLLDELHILDIGDAMILSRLFTALFDNKIFLVITSNYHPQDLYKDGLQRENFLPTIMLIEAKMQIAKMGGEIDYRLANTALARYFINDDKRFLDLFLTQGLVITAKTIDVGGRNLIIKKTIGKNLWSSFEELCSNPLSAADYQAIIKNFNTIFLSEIRVIQDRNELKRFIIFVDELYEHKTNLFCSAKCKPEYISQEPEFARTYSRLVEICSKSQGEYK